MPASAQSYIRELKPIKYDRCGLLLHVLNNYIDISILDLHVKLVLYSEHRTGIHDIINTYAYDTRSK